MVTRLQRKYYHLPSSVHRSKTPDLATQRGAIQMVNDWYKRFSEENLPISPILVFLMKVEAVKVYYPILFDLSFIGAVQAETIRL
jgi:hypothetical protein